MCDARLLTWLPQVTAFDLRPVAPQVYRADALSLRLGPPGSAAQTEPPENAADGAGRLLALPAASFHVAVLSLVLSYVPDPLHRTQARPHRVASHRMTRCRPRSRLRRAAATGADARGRARSSSPWPGGCCATKLGCCSSSRRFRPTGATVAAACASRPAVTPGHAGTDRRLHNNRSYRPDRALPIMKEWRSAIEALGFARVAAARLPSVHALAFRATPQPSPPPPLAPMRIAFDGMSAAQAAEARRAEEQGACGA